MKLLAGPEPCQKRPNDRDQIPISSLEAMGAVILHSIERVESTMVVFPTCSLRLANRLPSSTREKQAAQVVGLDSQEIEDCLARALDLSSHSAERRKEACQP